MAKTTSIKMKAKKKNTHGGKRKGAGAPLKYGEKTLPVVIRVPVSNVASFRSHSAAWLMKKNKTQYNVR